VYHIDWSDIQVSQFANSTNGLRFTYRGNGGKAKVDGVELELSARPTQAFQFGLGLAYTDSRLDEDLPIPEQGRKGDKLPYVLEWTASVNARYSWPMFQNWEGFVGGDYSYVDDTANRLRPTDRYYRVLESYDVLNLRLGLQGGDGWSTMLSVENALDSDEIISYPFGLPDGGCDQRQHSRSPRPRLARAPSGSAAEVVLSDIIQPRPTYICIWAGGWQAEFPLSLRLLDHAQTSPASTCCWHR
jgi:outer membrane cobalamin receptor